MATKGLLPAKARSPVDDYRQMATSTGRLKNRRRSGGQKEQGLLGGGIVDAEAALIDAYNRFELPDDALGLLSLPAKAAVGLGRMALTDISNLTQSIMQTDRSDPDAMARAATDGLKLMSGTGMAGGLLSRMTSTPKGAVLGANVYQGGPHKYGPEGAAESLKHMSKGEGAQAYGYGRYDAENIDVAKEYQRNLAVDKIRLNNKEVVSKHGYMNPDDVTDAFKLEYNLDDKTAFQMSQAARSPAPDLYFDSKAISFDKEFDLTGDKVFKEGAAEYRKYGKIWTDLNARLEKTTDSNLYKHDLPDSDIARYLDWDAPLSEQPKSVQDALSGRRGRHQQELLDAEARLKVVDSEIVDIASRNPIEISDTGTIDEQLASLFRPMSDADNLTHTKLWDERQILREKGVERFEMNLAEDAFDKLLDHNTTGEDLYKNLIKAKGKEGASKLLEEAGIPGLKYFDGMSRYHPNSLPDNRITNEARKWLDSADGDTDKALRSFYDSSPRNEFAGVEMDEVVKVIKQAGRKQTRNFVTWDQDVLNRMKLLERNGKKFGGLLTR